MKKIDKENIANRLKELVEEWENNPERMKDGFSYEQTFVKMMRVFEKEILQESIGEISKDKNAKKSNDQFRSDRSAPQSYLTSSKCRM